MRCNAILCTILLPKCHNYFEKYTNTFYNVDPSFCKVIRNIAGKLKHSIAICTDIFAKSVPLTRFCII